MNSSETIEKTQFLYHIAEASEPAQLAVNVEKMVAQGWRLQGGVSVVWSPVFWMERPTRYYQALTFTFVPADTQ
jgi:hypothetical protein